MRKIEIDLTENENIPRYRFAGFEGEHNATLLTVLLPERMRKGNEAEYRFLFETASGEAVFSIPLPLSEEGALSVLLTRSLMVAPELKAYVGCYVLEEGEPVLVAKSAEMVLGVQRSITDESGEMDSSGGKVPGLVIDAVLSDQSRNPVENRVVYGALAEKADKTDFNRFIPQVNEAVANANTAAEDAITVASAAAEAALKNTSAAANTAYDAAVDARRAASEIRNAKNKGEFNGEKGDPGIVDYSLVANAIKGKASGEVVVLTDVSPLEHEMAVKLTASVDLSSVTLKKFFGKNYSPVASHTWTGAWTTFKPTEALKAGKKYVFIADVATTSTDNAVTIYDSNGKQVYWEAGKNSSLVYTIGEKDVDGVWFHAQKGYVANSTNVATLNRFVIVEEQEPIPYTAEADGTVNGIIGNGESMTLLTDTEGVTITAEYNKDTNKVISNLMEKIAALETAAAELI